MKRKHVILSLLGIAVIGISLFRGKNPLSAGGELTEIEHWAVCRDLPANAHWTGTNVSDDGLRKEIPQKEQSPNIWIPSLQPELFTGGQGTIEICTFECDTGYTWDGDSCESSKGIFYGSGTITVSDGTTSITIMDRNLGATVAGTGKLYDGWPGGTCNETNGGDCRDPSYGKYYQRGNNYGFPSSGTVTTGNVQVDSGSSTFIVCDSSNSDCNGTYDRAVPKNDNLRGGSGDTQTNRMGRDADRQGPCPTGYHIPSQAEWIGLMSTWWNIYSGQVTNSGYNSSSSNVTAEFWGDNAGTLWSDTLLLPLAGNRYYDSSAPILNQGDYASYWSSSPNSTDARYLYFNPSYVGASFYDRRAYGFSLRCFQDSP